MQLAQYDDDSATRKHVRHYFHEVLERGTLPPLPAAVMTGLKLARNPEVDFRELGRVLANDAALTTRILRLTRSAHYGLRNSPNTLEHAIPVIGLQTLQRLLIVAGMQRLCGQRSAMSRHLWLHALATALTAELLARRTAEQDPHRAFLAGLLHDVGQMVLLYGDPVGFEALIRGGQADAVSVPADERQRYDTDHLIIGSMLLDYWELNLGITDAILHHHDDAVAAMEPTSLAALLYMADYLVGRAGYPFVSQPTPPPAPILAYWNCETPEALDVFVTHIRLAVETEMARYR